MDKRIRRPQEELLDKWAKRIAGLLKDGTDVFCYVHNPFEGHAPETVPPACATGVSQYLPLPDWNPTAGRPPAEEGQRSTVAVLNTSGLLTWVKSTVNLI